MATYPGMSLGGEVRESVSLDEDDLSDVEDEVFIRDGKNGYKFSEDAGLKRPLMAPRRKVGRPDLASRFNGRPHCKALCKPCCYVFGALVVLIGLIVLVVILVSMFPLPIDKIKSWIVSKTSDNVTVKILPCSDLKVTDVWTISLPKFISESPIRAVDVNSDGVDDFIFGFGTALENALHPNLFCPVFMGVSPPCEGGVMALNGTNGKILWKRWFLHSIFSIVCSVDVNSDGVPDCLIAGKGGILAVLNAKTGVILWQFEDLAKQKALVMDVYAPTFISDVNEDGIPDVLTSHTAQKDRSRVGHILLISGRDGKMIKKVGTPGNHEIYYTPQVFNGSNGDNLVLFGTGSPTSPGNLSVVPLKSIMEGTMASKTIYEDKYKGILSPSVLVDLTGDGQIDIVMAAFNSSVIALNGDTFKQLWNISLPNSETLSVPIPGYFNGDNVTDFLVKYQTGKDFPLYYYSQAYIIDGKNGSLIYSKGIVDTMGSQMGGLTLGMEGFGYDMFLYWIVNCAGYEGTQTPFKFSTDSTIKQQSNADLCKLRFNSTTVAKLFALNEFDQPPGLEIYSSDNRTFLELKSTLTAIEEAAEYFRLHPENDFQTDTAADVEEILRNRPSIPITWYNDRFSFRHKGNKQDLVGDGDFPNQKSKTSRDGKPPDTFSEEKKFDLDYDQQGDWSMSPNQYDINEPSGRIFDENNYFGNAMYNPSEFLVEETPQKMANRDPRSKIENPNTISPIDVPVNIAKQEAFPTDSSKLNSYKKTKTLKKNLSDAPFGPYGYQNIRMSRSRLLHDLSSSPSEILTDHYFKNREMQLKKSRFEQRDVKSHNDKLRENDEIKKIVDAEKEAAMNVSENLWDLESEKEAEDRENGYWRNKRSANLSIGWVPKITSMGVITNPINSTQNAIDLVFLTYWLPPKNEAQVLLEEDIKCIEDELKANAALKTENNFNKVSFKDKIEKQCIQMRLINSTKNTSIPNGTVEQNIPYYNQISQLRMGQMTVYRIRLECQCNVMKKGEVCAKFLKEENQNWSAYLGKLGDGFFRQRN